VARIYLIVVSILNGLAGLICGVLFIVSPDGSLMGFQPLIPVVQPLPLGDVFFRDLWWIGVAMLLVLAIPNLAGALMLLRRSESQYRVTLIAAVLLMLWCGFEIAFMFNVAAAGYFLIGTISAFCSIILLRTPARASA
jgi:hypothetical protein